MSRPTRFCLTCGEYIAVKDCIVQRFGSVFTEKRLVHIDANGYTLARAHAVVEDLRGHDAPLLSPPKPPNDKPPMASVEVAGKTRKTKSGK